MSTICALLGEQREKRGGPRTEEKEAPFQAGQKRRPWKFGERGCVRARREAAQPSSPRLESALRTALRFKCERRIWRERVRERVFREREREERRATTARRTAAVCGAAISNLCFSIHGRKREGPDGRTDGRREQGTSVREWDLHICFWFRGSYCILLSS